jgi:DNA polymerase-3 subunit chi
MTRIDFHSNVPDKINYTCRLIRKARAADCRIIVFDNDRTQLDLLNEALWTFSESDFLPHVLFDDPLAAQTPIILTENDSASFPHHELLINLTQIVPNDYSRFARVIEVISTEQQDTLAGRERYRHYQQQGISLTHTIAKSS